MNARFSRILFWGSGHFKIRILVSQVLILWDKVVLPTLICVVRTDSKFSMWQVGVLGWSPFSCPQGTMSGWYRGKNENLAWVGISCLTQGNCALLDCTGRYFKEHHLYPISICRPRIFLVSSFHFWISWRPATNVIPEAEFEKWLFSVQNSLEG